jgi:hypothetical protein
MRKVSAKFNPRDMKEKRESILKGSLKGHQANTIKKPVTIKPLKFQSK